MKLLLGVSRCLMDFDWKKKIYSKFLNRRENREDERQAFLKFNISVLIYVVEMSDSVLIVSHFVLV